MHENPVVGRSLGRYHIIESLGQGGMAAVFRAYDTSLERDVAIKVIRPDVHETNGGEFLRRFQREARALAQLDHPFILKVLDYGEQDGLPYLVMPFVPGGTLKLKMGRAVPYPEAAALLAPVARALDYAHHQKIIHRDIKPANILISQSGAPLLSDFGIAKMLEAGGSTQLTATGMGIGTPDYMAPEQWLGSAGPLTDLYSLGIVFYEMVTGRLPYTADTPAAVLLKHLNDPLPRARAFVPGLPAEVEQVLFKVLAKEPANRFQDMGKFAEVLEKLARHELPPMRPLPPAVATLLEPDLNVPARAAPTPSGAQPAAQPGLSRNLTIGLAAAGILLLAVVVCLGLGGVLFASRGLLLPGQATATKVVRRTVLPNPAQATPLPARLTLTPTPAAPTPTPGVTPITAIQGLPDDVPVLKQNNGDLITQNSPEMSMYSFSTGLSPDAVLAFYRSAMLKNGWQVASETSSSTETMLYFMKGEQRSVMIAVFPQDGTNYVSIMLPIVP